MTAPTRGDIDIPGGVLAAFVLGLSGWIVSGFAGLVVAGDLLDAGQQEDLTDAATSTIIGLAFAPVLAIVTGILALGFKLRTQKLGRSLAWGAVVLGFLGLLNLIGYAIQLGEIEENLEVVRAQQGGVRAPTAPVPDDPMDALNVPLIADPLPGLWVTLDGQGCSYEFVDADGQGIDFGFTGAVEVPEDVAEFQTDPGCAWRFVGR